MKKVIIFFWFVLALITSTNKVVASVCTREVAAKHTKQLCYDTKTDSQTPAEIKLICFSAASGSASIPNSRGGAGLAKFCLNKSVFKNQVVQYPLYIKERIGNPVFLRNNCLRI